MGCLKLLSMSDDIFPRLGTSLTHRHPGLVITTCHPLMEWIALGGALYSGVMNPSELFVGCLQLEMRTGGMCSTTGSCYPRKPRESSIRLGIALQLTLLPSSRFADVMLNAKCADHFFVNFRPVAYPPPITTAGTPNRRVITPVVKAFLLAALPPKVWCPASTTSLGICLRVNPALKSWAATPDLNEAAWAFPDRPACPAR